MASIGYKLTFCKKLSDKRNTVDNKAFDYRVLGHFDGLFVDEINEIKQFGETCADFTRKELSKIDRNLSDDEKNNLIKKAEEKLHILSHCEKQVLNLLTDKINDNNKSFWSSQFPVTVVSLINCEKSGCAKDDCVIRNYLNLVNPVNYAFQVFKPLSIESLAIVYKASTVNDILAALSELRKADCFDEVSSIYSIISLKKDGVDCSAENINIYIKIQAIPSCGFRTIYEKIHTYCENNNLSCDNAFTSFGKYDITLCIKSNKKVKLNDYIKLYDEELNTFSEKKKSGPSVGDREIQEYIDPKNPGILSTETVFLSTADDKNPNFVLETQPRENPWSKWNGRYNREWTKLGKERPVFNKFSRMLGERAHRLLHSFSSSKFFSAFWEFIAAFTIKIPRFIEQEPDKRYEAMMQVGEEIQSLIAGIDDVFSTSFHDFEQSQKDALCVHSAGKLMVSYRNFAEYIGVSFLGLSNYRNHAFHSIVSDISEKTYISEIKVEKRTKRDINDGNTIAEVDNVDMRFFTIHMPYSNIYNFTAAIFKITHEIGHSFKTPIPSKTKDEYFEKCIEALTQNDNFLFNDKEKKDVEKYAITFYEEFAADIYAIKALGIDKLYQNVNKHQKRIIKDRIAYMFEGIRLSDLSKKLRISGLVLALDPEKEKTVKISGKDFDYAKLMEDIKVFDNPYVEGFASFVTEKFDIPGIKTIGDIVKAVGKVAELFTEHAKKSKLDIIKGGKDSSYLEIRAALLCYLIPDIAYDSIMEHETFKQLTETSPKPGAEDKIKEFLDTYKSNLCKEAPDENEVMQSFLLAFTDRVKYKKISVENTEMVTICQNLK
jgi:hypothetical protein